MKNLLFIVLLSIFTVSCVPQNKVNTDQTNSLKPEKNEDGEWELHVLDTQYDYFLNAIAKPMSFYSEEQLKSRNNFLVTEWNSYYYSGKYRNIIESGIDYNPRENYGLKFEYRLYQVFAYVQWKYGLKMNGLSGADIR